MWLWIVSGRVITNTHRAHQRQYPAEVIVVVCETPVNRCGTRCILQGSMNKGIFDKVNADGTIQECINRYE